MSGSAFRYCQCGKRLAHDRAGARCAACEQGAIGLRAVPQKVPADFWDTDQFRDAFDAQHMGQVARAYRKHPLNAARYGRAGIPQEVLAAWFGLTQAQVSRIENGAPIRNLDTLVHWARMLDIPERLLWFRLPGQRPGIQARERALIDLPTLQPTVPAGSFRLIPIGRGVTDEGDADAAAMRAFRSADLRVGGGHLYASVVSYLQADVAPRLFGGADRSASVSVFTAAAALTEMAGWMAHDAGRDEVAKQHFGRSLALVQVGGDRQLGAHVLGSMSHLASHFDQPDEAIALARQGKSVLQGGSPNPDVEARLLAMEARGFAARRDRLHCAELLIEAERVLDSTLGESPSSWVSRFDEGSLASEAARCMRRLGDWAEAGRQAERVIALRPAGGTRSRAFGQLGLAVVLAVKGRFDEACAIAQDVLDATQALGSYLVIQQLLDVQRLLEPHSGSAVVGQFLARMDEAVRDRLWLYQWLKKDG